METLVIPDGAANTQRNCDELIIFDDRGPVIGLDLSAVQFVGPLFLVRLRAWLDYHADHMGLRVVVEPPATENVQSYMSRMHLLDGFSSNVEFALPNVRENHRGDRLIPLTKLVAEADNEFDDLLGELLSPHGDMRYAGYLGEAVKGGAQEMADNAVNHGANPIGAYVAAQRFENPRAKIPHRCVLAIGDFGIGMAAHLTKGGEGRDTDATTIAHGLTDQVTGTGVYGRGRGYSIPFEIAKRKGAAYTVLQIRANDAWVRLTNEASPRTLADGKDESTPGTWVEFEFAHATPPPSP